MGEGVSGTKAISIAVTGPSLSSVDSKASAVALRENPREVHTAATQSTPVWRTDIINTYTYGHGDGHDKDMFSFDEFPAIGVVKSGKTGSVGVAGIGKLLEFGASGIGIGIKIGICRQRQVACYEI